MKIKYELVDKEIHFSYNDNTQSVKGTIPNKIAKQGQKYIKEHAEKFVEKTIVDREKRSATFRAFNENPNFKIKYNIKARR